MTRPPAVATGEDPLSRSATLLRGAVAGGLAGALSMSALLLLLRAVGLSSMNLELLLGSAVTRSVDGSAWLVGFGVHLCFGVLFALVYGSVLQAARRGGPTAGAALGLAHAVASGIALPLIMSFHPLVIGGPLVNPGFFGWNLGLREVVVFLLAHLLYGAVAGSLLGAPRPAPTPAEGEAERIPRRRLVARR